MKRFRLLFICGLLGYTTVALLAARHDVSRQWQQTLDRQQAIAAAAAIAARHGLEVSQWNAAVVTERQRDQEYFLATRPNHEAARLLTPLATSVVFGDPQSKRSFRVRLDRQGRLLDFSQSWDDQAAPAQSPAAAPRALAETALNELTAGAGWQFSPISESDVDREQRPGPPRGGDKRGVQVIINDPGNQPQKKFTQEYVTAGEAKDQIRVVATAIIEKGQVKSASLRPVMPAGLPDEQRLRRNTIALIVTNVAIFLVFVVALLALVFFFLGLIRKSVEIKTTLLFFGVLLALMLVGNGFGSLLEDFRQGWLSDKSATTILISLVTFSLLLIGLALFPLMNWGGGLALYSLHQQGRPESLAALLRGKLLARPVGLPVAAGILFGGLLAAIPYLVAASGLFQSTMLDLPNAHRLFASRIPTLAALTSGVHLNSAHTFFLFIIFAFLLPCLYSFLKNKLLARLLGLLAGTLLLTSVVNLLPLSFAAVLTTAAAVMIVGEQIWRRFDLLTVVIAGLSSDVLLRSVALLNQPSASLRSSGAFALVALGVLLIGALVIAFKGKDVRLEDIAGLEDFKNRAEDQAERERLKGEFSVAQKAQQQMLPSETPDLPGFSLAALCRPSKEVGGDLYDFIPMTNGRLGVVVADVSGKGVPASLYMTLTKGLMLSVAEEKNDPGEILREVNKHLYDACQRKMFVTLFFGVLDPTTRTMTYARAGHNPPVWRKVAEQSATLLKPPGPGLGLVTSNSFDRVLKVEQIQLRPHDTLLLYSDGISEAMNAQQEEYGEERLIQAAARTDGLTADDALNLVIGDVSAFLGPVPPQDDQTLVVVRVNGN